MSMQRTIFYFALVVVGGISVLVTAVLVPNVGVSVPIIAVGLAVALQKYTASIVASFVISFSRIYGLGDRVRIGNVKGDVRQINLLHTVFEEVGDDEKMGGELTGRLIQVPNMLILDQPVLNYSKDVSVHNRAIASDYMFDEVRIPLDTTSNAEKACELLERILLVEDRQFVTEAKVAFGEMYPRFLDEAVHGPRVMVHLEPGCIWIKGKFVCGIASRNALRSRIILRFLDEMSLRKDMRIAESQELESRV